MSREHYQTVDRPPPPKNKAPGGGALFGVHVLIPHFKFQSSKSIKPSTFHPLRKISRSQNAQKSLKNLHKTAIYWLMI